MFSNCFSKYMLCFIACEVCIASYLFTCLSTLNNIFFAYLASPVAVQWNMFLALAFLGQLFLLNTSSPGCRSLAYLWTRVLPELSSFWMLSYHFVTVCTLITWTIIIYFMTLFGCLHFYEIYRRGLHFFDAQKGLIFMTILDYIV